MEKAGEWLILKKKKKNGANIQIGVHTQKQSVVSRARTNVAADF